MCSIVQEKPVIGKFPIDMWNGQVMKNLDLRVLGTVLCVHLKQFRKKFNKNAFGRMIRYLNDKGGYQVDVSSLKKTVHSHVYFKSERVCISLVVETGLENAVAEDVVAENRQKDDTMS
jgi:hypothetical protein